MTSLHWAARNGYARTVEFLVYSKAATNLQDNQKRTPLHWAALNGEINTVAQLFLSDDTPAVLDTRDSDGLSALDIAANKGHTDVVNLLLNKGAGTVAERQILLEKTLINNKKENYSTIKLLLDKDIRIRPGRNATMTNALTDAFKQNADIDDEILPYMKTLIACGANIEHSFPVRNTQQRIIIHNLVEHPDKISPYGRLGLVEYLSTPDLPSKIKDKLTPDFLNKLVYNELSISEKVHPNASHLVKLLKDKDATITYEALKKIPHLHTLASFFGNSQLCELAGIRVGGPNSFRLHAQVEICKLEYPWKDKVSERPAEINNKIEAWKTVVNETNDKDVTQKLGEALEKTQGSVSRMFKLPIDKALPEELKKNLRIRQNRVKFPVSHRR